MFESKNVDNHSFFFKWIQEINFQLDFAIKHTCCYFLILPYYVPIM